METYKIGNKIKCLIRAYKAGTIGDKIALYDGEPYTIIQDVTASISFNNKTDNVTIQQQRELFYNADDINECTISNIPLTEKIIALIFKKNSDVYRSVSDNYVSDDNGLIYLNADSTVYTVYVYDEDGSLEAAHDEITDGTITVNNANSSYLIVYYEKAEYGYSLYRDNNLYVTLDLQAEGNTDDETTDMYIHLDKCGFRINKNLYFNQNSNAIDLVFNVLSTKDNYIIVK